MVAPKPVEQRLRRNMPAVMGVSANLDIPKPPSGLSEPLLAAWQGLWESPVAQLIDPVSDLPAVTRLFSFYQKQEHLDAFLLTEYPGSETFAPTMTVMLRVASEARQLEAALGLSPRSRLALGLALMAGKKASSLDDALDGLDD